MLFRSVDQNSYRRNSGDDGVMSREDKSYIVRQVLSKYICFIQNASQCVRYNLFQNENASSMHILIRTLFLFLKEKSYILHIPFI